MKKTFTFLFIFSILFSFLASMPAYAGSVDLLEHEWNGGWGTSYNSSTKTITFEYGWAAFGLNTESLETSNWLSMTATFTSNAPKGVLHCDYNEGGNSEVSFENESSKTMSFETGKTLSKVYIKLESSGTLQLSSITVTTSTTTYTVLVTASNGTVSGTGDFAENEEVTLTATPNENYSFTSWSTSDVDLSGHENENPLTFTMPDNDVSITANFTACSGQTVTVSVNNGTMGSATGGGSYCAGAQVDLEAIPESGYRFVNWTVTSGSASLDDARSETTHFVMSNPATAVTIRANFEEDIKADRTYTYRAVEDNTGHNTDAEHSTADYLYLTDGGHYIDFTHYSAIATTCTIKVGYRNNSGDKPYKITVNGGQEKTGNTSDSGDGERDMGAFTLSEGDNIIRIRPDWTYFGIRYIKVIVNESKYSVTVVNDDTHGTVTAASSNFAGEVVNISVDAKPGYFFSGWASADVTFDNASATSTTFEMPANNVTISTTYTTCTQRTVTLAADNVERGSVSGGGDYCEGASVTVTATPVDGYRFVNWTQGGSQVSTDAVYTFTLSEDISLTANFAVEICSNNLTIQCEEGTYRINSALLTKGTSIPNYKIANNWYSGADGNYVDFNNHTGEIYYIIDLPAATYSFTVYKAHAGDSWLNIWEAGLDNALTYDGVDYGKHHGNGYDIKGDNTGDKNTPIHNSTISNVTLSAGTYIIGLYGNDYAVYDKIVITANSNVFCPTYDITMVNNMGGAAPTADKVKAEENASVSISAAATIGEFSFTGWTASPEVTFADASAISTTFTMPAEAVAITANYNTYSRTGAPIAAGNYGTICLPLNGTVTGATLYSVAGKEISEKTYIVLEDKGTSLEAGKPYIFQLSADELRVALDGTYTDLQDGNGLVGTYETIDLTPYAEPGTLNYFLYANAFKKAGTGVTVGAYRAYLDWDAVSAAPAQAPSARRIRMVIEGTEVQTGMETVTAMPKTTKVLIDGQLFIIREGKRYTFTGARAQ